MRVAERHHAGRGAERGGGEHVHGRGLHAAEDERQRQRQLDPAQDLRAGQAHAARGVDRLGVDGAHADVGVGRIGGMASRTRASVTLKKPAPRAAKNRTTSADRRDGAPALVTLTTRNEPAPAVARARAPSGSAIAVAIPTETTVMSRCSRSSGSSWVPPTCAPPGPSLLGEDELERVAEAAEEGERHAVLTRVHGVSRRWASSRMASRPTAISTQSAAADRDVRDELILGGHLLAEPAGAREDGQRRQPHRRRRGDPQPGHDLRQRQRQLDAPQQLAVGQAHAAAGVARLVGHAVEARRRCCGR